MQGHGLMQAIARVNRVFRDKPGGLVVDYLGLADQLKQALATYTESGGQGSPSVDRAEAVAVLQEKHEVICGLLHGLDWSAWATGTPAARLQLLPEAQEHVLAQEKGRERFVAAVTDIYRAFALCAASDVAQAMRDDIAFFQAVKAQVAKRSGSESRSPEDMESAIRQLVSRAITTEGEIIDVFSAAGIKKPDISILSDQFLAEVRGLKHKNVAAELLSKLLHDEIKKGSKKNVVVSRTFAELLQRTLNAYHNRAIATQEVIEELIRMAKDFQKARGAATTEPRLPAVWSSPPARSSASALRTVLRLTAKCAASWRSPGSARSHGRPPGRRVRPPPPRPPGRAGSPGGHRRCPSSGNACPGTGKRSSCRPAGARSPTPSAGARRGAPRGGRHRLGAGDPRGPKSCPS